MTDVRSVVRVVINSGARTMQDQAARDALSQVLEDALPGALVRFTDDEHNVSELVDLCMADHPTMLVAGGGDGTVNAVASAVHGTSIVLGVLPLGTLNHFAHDLSIPGEIEAAVQTLRDGTVAPIDAAEVNGRLFVNNSGLGLYPDIVHQREARQRRGWGKWPAALVSTIRALARYRMLGVRIRTGETVLLRRTPALMIGNNEYTTEGILGARRVSMTAGTLALYCPRPHGRLHLLWFSLRALLGSLRKTPEFETVLTDAITIESRHPHLRVAIDGEVTMMKTPLHYRALPGALHVMLPAVVPEAVDEPADADTQAPQQVAGI